MDEQRIPTPTLQEIRNAVATINPVGNEREFFEAAKQCNELIASRDGLAGLIVLALTSSASSDQVNLGSACKLASQCLLIGFVAGCAREAHPSGDTPTANDQRPTTGSGGAA